MGISSAKSTWWVSARAVDMPMSPVNGWTLLARLSLGGATIGSVVAGILFGNAGWGVALLFVILWVVVSERRP